jgi:hypothetical protein
MICSGWQLDRLWFYRWLMINLLLFILFSSPLVFSWYYHTLQYWTDQRLVWIMTSQVLVVASLGMLPIVPNHISSKAYRLSLLGTICSSTYSLYCTYGVSVYYYKSEWIFCSIVYSNVLVFCSYDSCSALETKGVEYACNPALVATYNGSQGLHSFDVLSYDVYVQCTFKE